MTGADVTVRSAQHEDHPVVTALIDESVASLPDTPSSRYLLREFGHDLDTVAALLADAASLVVIGSYAGVDCGLTVASRDGGAGAHGAVTVRWLYVGEGFQRCGVAEEMLEAVSSWTAEVGAHVLDVLVAPGDRATKSFLEASGLKARAIVMSRLIAGLNLPRSD